MSRFSEFPRSLADKARSARFNDVPVLLAHPDWQRPAPTVLWMHGRTASKELDPGRYLRWIRAGIAACAIDLPGHGERHRIDFQHPRATVEILSQMLGEVDRVVEALAGPEYSGLFDGTRLAIGGMSAGGMAALRRLCDPHPFRCAAVEATTGWLTALYFPDAVGLDPLGTPSDRWQVQHDRARVEGLDPMEHLSSWAPIPLLALHSEADKIIPVTSQRRFIDALRDRYRQAGADPTQVELVTWPQTGAPEEHIGFGNLSNEAKNLQTAFLVKHLAPSANPG